MASKRLKLAFTVAGTVIGAGFATGKELLLFFGNEPFSLWYLLLSMLLMLTVSLMYFSQQKTSWEQHPFLRFLKILFLCFSAASYAVMLACGGEALWETTNLPFPIGTVLTFLITLGIVRFGVQNVYRFNMLATPVLLICMAGISLAGLLSPVGLFEPSGLNSVNLLIYSGYNLLSVLPLISALTDTVEKKDGYTGILLGFFFVTVVGLLLKGLLLQYIAITANSAIPVLTVISHLHSGLNVLYAVMLYLSVLTTAVNSFYAVTKGNSVFSVGLLLLCCSFLGFSSLIETLYPFFGYLGIGVTLTVIIKAFYQ